MNILYLQKETMFLQKKKKREEKERKKETMNFILRI